MTRDASVVPFLQLLCANSSVSATPTLQERLGVDRAAPGADLEVQVAAYGAGVAGLADSPDALACPNRLPSSHQGRPAQVRVEVGAALPPASDQHEVAVEDRVVTAPRHHPVRRRHERRPAAGNYVEPLVRASAAARSPELADRPTLPVRRVDRECMRPELRPTAARLRRGGKQKEGNREEEGGAGAQWCSMTRSTRLYSFASSALMK